jgi:transcription initiation factor IIE alpha subunit
MKTLFVLLVFVSSSFITFAQSGKGQKSRDTSSTEKSDVIYYCVMHPEVTSDKPGKCPKCDKDLTRSTKEQMKMEVMNKYSCPMHPEVMSDKPGKCPKCNNDLTLSKKEQMKTEVMKVYTCPMHPEYTSNMPGTCPKCDKKLVVKKSDAVKENK